MPSSRSKSARRPAPSSPYNNGRSVQSLDLHGLTKERAVQNLTFFLDQIRYRHPSTSSSIEVEVITGSGKHSSDGPVLRNAVEKLLKKRQMTFRLKRGNGSFVVDALSGIDLYHTMQGEDSKVVLQPRTGEDVRLVNRPLNQLNHAVTNITSANIYNHNDDDDGEGENGNINKGFLEDAASDPLPHEVARDDELVSKTKHLSHEEYRKEVKRSKDEQEAMKRAKEESLSLHEQELEHEKHLHRAMEETKLEQEKSEREEVEEMKLILEWSKKDHEESCCNVNVTEMMSPEEEDSKLQEILKQSARDAQLEQERRGRKREEEDLIKRAMEESMAMAATPKHLANASDSSEDRKPSSSSSSSPPPPLLLSFEEQMKLAMEQSLQM